MTMLIVTLLENQIHQCHSFVHPSMEDESRLGDGISKMPVIDDL